MAAQKAFDEAVDAIDRSGLKKDMRKGLAVDLQEAFIKLVKDEGDGNIPDSGGGGRIDGTSPQPASGRTQTLPPWFELKVSTYVSARVTDLVTSSINVHRIPIRSIRPHLPPSRYAFRPLSVGRWSQLARSRPAR